MYVGLFTDNDVEQILEEVVKMKDFKHRHIMPLIGVCLDSGVGVVMPYMTNGSVLNYLKKNRESLLLSDEAEIDQVRTIIIFDKNSKRRYKIVFCYSNKLSPSYWY